MGGKELDMTEWFHFHIFHFAIVNHIGMNMMFKDLFDTLLSIPLNMYLAMGSLAHIVVLLFHLLMGFYMFFHNCCTILQFHKWYTKGFLFFFILANTFFFILKYRWVHFSSVQSLSHVRLCAPMHRSTAGLPVHHQIPEFTQTHVHWVCDAISFSVIPFSSCLQFFPASESFLMSQFFTSGGQGIGVAASTSILPMIIQD